MKTEAYLLVCLSLEFTATEFTPNRRVIETPCDQRGTSLVEQFFNVIFTEFQHSPPTCTCVQMCPDQPTFCYPNGCFKRAEVKRETSPVSKIQQDGSKMMFLISDDKDIFTEMADANFMTSTLAVPAEQYIKQPLEVNVRNNFNPIKDVFKYKKLPKMKMKYNLREQVKHTKDRRAEVDVSKTRWPMNKQINRNYKVNYQKSLTYPETNQLETPKYFRRYLTKRQSQNELDISALYLYKDASNFSLETLIDNLIERGLDDVNSTLGLEISNSSKSIEESNKSYAQSINSLIDDRDTSSLDMMHSFENKNNVISQNVTNNVKLNENSTSRENGNNNIDNVINITNNYSEMITTLSREIEKQNNISIEVMENFAGKKIRDMVIQDLINNTGNVAGMLHDTTLEMSVQEIKSTTNKVPASLHKAFVPVINGQVKKSKQRIARKLRNRKLN